VGKDVANRTSFCCEHAREKLLQHRLIANR
jgi:hypothetical protein